jgi:alpha-aminoadipic semialdehyde synthase
LLVLQTNAIITTPEGKLSSNFKYLHSIMKRTPKQTNLASSESSPKSMTIMLEGHLFDSGLINQVLDTFDTNNCVEVKFKECHVQQKGKEGIPVKSRAIITVTGGIHTDFSKVELKIAALVAAIESADATFRRIDHTSYRKKESPAYVVKNQQQTKSVLLLGSGRVSKSVVDFLGRSKDLEILVASNDEKEAREVASFANRGRHTSLDIANDSKGLSDLISGATAVISLLPVPMHPQVAEMCIDNKTDLVTASYESDAMRKLDERYISVIFRGRKQANQYDSHVHCYLAGPKRRAFVF